MIRHTVLVRFADHVDAGHRAELFRALGDLCDQLPRIVDFGFGPNISPEAPVVHGFHDGFWFDVVDAPARDAYLLAPAHTAVGRRLVAACAGGTDGLVAFDVEI